MNEGFKVGEVEGQLEGKTVGTSVVGEFDGRFVGCRVGLGLVGDCEGWDNVGPIVGHTLGLKEGVSVGVLVGAAVGWHSLHRWYNVNSLESGAKQSKSSFASSSVT